MSGVFILARNSASSGFFLFVKPYTSALDWFKQESDQLSGSVLASMALTQRLEFRQSQSLVMTPQLMQAIKLLQLSNLDLSAFVEEELERNPLLDRASDGPEAPVPGEPTPELAEFSEPDEAGAAYSEEAGTEPSEMVGPSGDSFEQGGEDWINRDLGSRSEIEQTLDAPLDNVFSEEPAEAAARNAQDA